MKIARSKLKQIILQVLLSEGQAEDLISKFPELQSAYDSGITNPQYLQWIQKRRGGEPVDDVIGVVQAFDTAKPRLKSKGISTDIYAYKTPGVLRQALEDLGGSKGVESRRLKDEETTYLGTFGDWVVAMPHTRESSCQLGKGTTWCTAATQSQNLFLSYTAFEDKDIVLYYIIKKGVDSRKDPTAKLSVGFMEGQPVIDGSSGGLSVDANNKGLTKNRLSQILGDQFEPIMRAMKANTDLIGGKHPAKTQMKTIAMSKDPDAISAYIQGLDGQAKEQFAYKVIDNEPDTEVLIKLSSDDDQYVRGVIASSDSTPPEILMKLSNDEFERVRDFVAENPSTPPEALMKLSDDNSGNVRRGVAENPSTPPEVLMKLSNDHQSGNDQSEFIVIPVAKNPSTPPEALLKLSKDKSLLVRRGVAENPSTPPEVLIRLARDKEEYIRTSVAQNRFSPPEVLLKLSNDKERYTRARIASNPSAPPEALAKLSNDSFDRVRVGVAKNPSTPPEVLVKLSSDEFPYVRRLVSKNPTYKKHIKQKSNLQERQAILAEDFKTMKLTKAKIKQIIREELRGLV